MYQLQKTLQHPVSQTKSSQNCSALPEGRPALQREKLCRFMPLCSENPLLEREDDFPLAERLFPCKHLHFAFVLEPPDAKHTLKIFIGF